MDELLILKEQENFEFKRQLLGGRDISYEIGAFANTPGGGLILIGVEDSGEVVGVELREKPCTVSGKVYLRVDSSARMAKSQEIRNMILR